MEFTASSLTQRLLERDAFLASAQDRVSSAQEKAAFLGRMRDLAPGLDETFRYSNRLSSDQVINRLSVDLEPLFQAFAMVSSLPPVQQAIFGALNSVSLGDPDRLGLPSDERDAVRTFLRRIAADARGVDPDQVSDRLRHASSRYRSELWASLLEDSNALLESVLLPQNTPASQVPPLNALLAGLSAGAYPTGVVRPNRGRRNTGRPISDADDAKASVTSEMEEGNMAAVRWRDDLEERLLGSLANRANELREELLTRIRERLDGYTLAVTDLQRRLSATESENRALSDSLRLVREENQRTRSQQDSAQMLLDRIVDQLPKQHAQIDALEARLGSLEESLRARLDRVILPVFIDLRDKDVDASAAQPIVDAVLDLLRSAGFEPDARDAWEIRTGSFFARLSAVFNAALGRDGIEGKLKKVEAGLTSRFVRLPESQVSLNEADATSRLISSLSGIHNAVMAIGPIILVKRTGTGGAVDMFIVPLTERIRARMDADPSCLASPNAFYAVLRDVQDTGVRSLQVFEPRK